MGQDQPPSFARLLATPMLVAAFTCGTIGSFVMWRARLVHANGRWHVPFNLHFFHNDSTVGEASVACIIGLLALALPISLVAQIAAS